MQSFRKVFSYIYDFSGNYYVKRSVVISISIVLLAVLSVQIMYGDSFYVKYWQKVTIYISMFVLFFLLNFNNRFIILFDWDFKIEFWIGLFLNIFVGSFFVVLIFFVDKKSEMDLIISIFAAMHHASMLSLYAYKIFQK
ncbi:hypothetical protein TALK_08285 [Thalassospira alkalitolerans]|uniref:Uncharacterized protein n=1 Tax=Thalassospira alkalitolerans TaxID=1293890 RepID=A0A1Y2LCP8_9PROT|nr:hypothetical protein TALK_08285 [Thalassospira alkalitolerans]